MSGERDEIERGYRKERERERGRERERNRERERVVVYILHFQTLGIPFLNYSAYFTIDIEFYLL